MRLEQRFRRVPSQEPQEEGLQLPAYPSQTKMDYSTDKGRPFQTNTEYSAATYDPVGYTISHRKTLVERVKDYEHRRFHTRFFGKFYDTFVGGWRAGLVHSFLLSFVALVVNISVYTWLFRTYDAESGTAMLRKGSCGMIRNANTGIHAALNVVSTLILGASAYAMQAYLGSSKSSKH
jgi:hypothetical protein